MTGFIGEFFGAAQAVKVANAEGNVIAHFNHINEERRRFSLRENLFGAVLDALYNNTCQPRHRHRPDPCRAIYQLRFVYRG